ncbi:DegT/DnrJ/EryC1/StrS family aminotransferase, partial [bacterium]|nr:DegT/DnrJ/EryC1/StrS family aminotransferase [bacterium]
MKKKDLLRIIPGPEPKMKVKIPVCEPKLEGNELKYVTECIKTNWISSRGDYIEKFEKMFSKCCGARYGIACTSGTTALHLALASLDIGKGDEVIIPAFTMIATANAITYTGARMVLVDSEPKTWNIDPEKIERKISKRTRAIIPVHTYGHPANMDKILALAKKYDLFIIEDACEAHGAEYKGRRIGSLGDVACFSFYANKIITTGEGGMLTTNNKEIAQRARTLRNYAFSQERHFWHKYLGFNYRMTNLQAAI